MDCPSTPTKKPLNENTNTYTTQRTPFATPRRRKIPATSTFPPTSDKKWPQIGKKVQLHEIISVAKQIFGYEPHPWQLRMSIKSAEGFDTFGIAGTSFGKSLVFALLAIAAELAGFKGTVMVICPLNHADDYHKHLVRSIRFSLFFGVLPSLIVIGSSQ
jgi:hypothetical protein